MLVRDDALRQARLELGYRECPQHDGRCIFTGHQGVGKNHQKFAGEVGHANGYAWCASFVSAIFKRLGLTDRPNTAGATAMADWFRSHGLFMSRQWVAPPDAIVAVFFHFEGEHAGENHVELLEVCNSDGTLTDIGGNTSSDDNGSQSNGGGVFRRHRTRKAVTGFGWLRQDGGSTTPQPTGGSILGHLGSTPNTTDDQAGDRQAVVLGEAHDAVARMEPTMAQVLAIVQDMHDRTTSGTAGATAAEIAKQVADEEDRRARARLGG